MTAPARPPLPQISAVTSYTQSHYYLDQDLNNKSRYSISSGQTICIHLNGHNITSTSQVFWQGGGNSLLNVMGNGIVKGSYTSADNNYGATMHFSSATAKVALYGGIYGKTIKSSEHTITLEASQPKLTIYSGATLCRMEDARGANIEIRSGSVELRGGKILDGTTADTGYGGNVRVTSSATYTSWPSTFTMYDGVIAGGRAKYGGNVYVYRESGHGSKPRTFTMEGGLMCFGFVGYGMGSTGSGGNIYARTGSVINLNGGLVTYGKSYSSGGNIYAKEGSQVTIGGIVENGNGNYGSKADISGGTATTAGPDVRLHAAATVKMTDGSMGIVYGTTGKFTLSGDASIKKLTMTTGTLKLDAAWKGSMNLIYDASTIEGGKLTKVTCGDSILGKVMYNNTQPVKGIDGADFATETGDINIATVGAAPFASGLETTSTSVFGILKNSRKPELNDRYGKMPIYANTYVELADGTVVMGENGTGRSLCDVLAAIDRNWADYEESQTSILEFFRAWATKGLSSWEFTNIQ